MDPERIPHYPPEEGFKKVVTDKFKGARVLTPDLVEALRQGDVDAYKALYEITYRPLHAFIKRLYRGLDADDIAQAALVEIWDKRESIDPSRNVGGLLFHIAVGYANKLHRRRKVELSYLNRPEGSSNNAAPPDEHLIDEQTMLLYEIALSQMPARRRLIFELWRNEKLTYDQIAARLGISKQTVNYNLNLARKELRELLALMLVLMSLS